MLLWPLVLIELVEPGNHCTARRVMILNLFSLRPNNDQPASGSRSLTCDIPLLLCCSQMKVFFQIIKRERFLKPNEFRNLERSVACNEPRLWFVFISLDSPRNAQLNLLPLPLFAPSAAYHITWIPANEARVLRYVRH